MSSDEERELLLAIQLLLERGGFAQVTVRFGARLKGFRTCVFTNGGRSFAVSAEHFLREEAVGVIGIALRQIMSDDELREIATRVGA